MSRTLRLTILTLITLLISLPEFSQAQDPSQAELDYVQSWIFENEVTQNPDRFACRPVESKAELAKQNAEWVDVWRDVDASCSRAVCKGKECNQVCNNGNCMNGKLGILGMISEFCPCSTCASCTDGCESEVSTASTPGCSKRSEATCEKTCCSNEKCCDGDATCSAKTCCDEASCCATGECEDCSMCNRNLPTTDCPQSCTAIAEMLRMTLENKSMNSPTAQKAISHAITMAYNNGMAAAASDVENLKLKHANEMAVLRGRALQMSTQIRTVDDIRNWMEPLYTNQNRANHQIQLMGASTSALHRTLSLLEKQLSTISHERPPAKKFTNPHVKDSPTDGAVYDLQREISQLKQQLRSLQKEKSPTVQPAQHLQPIPGRQFSLEPMKSQFPSIDWPSNQSQYRR